MATAAHRSGGFFERLVLPGLAFKAVVIGGGYATGREIAEFFLGPGPRGGLQGLLLATIIWSGVCALTFLFARRFAATDYRTFFRQLLGPFWILFEITYILFMVLVLAVMAAAAGTIGAALFDLPEWAGTVLLMAATIAVSAFGTDGAERLFRYSSLFIYTTYALFLGLALASFGDQILPQLAAPTSTEGWLANGATYASYNVVAAVLILPFLRHQRRDRDAVVAGLLSGPMAMLPALLFFLCMVAFYPEIGDEALPSDFLLRQLGAPWFHVLFQLMIFCALLETGVGLVNAINARAADAARRRDRAFNRSHRLGVAAVLVIGSGALAAQFGLVALIARGYGAFGYIMLALFVLPLATVGTLRLFKSAPSKGEGDVPQSAPL
jgi:uncharacterized membrane protein YkvI